MKAYSIEVRLSRQEDGLWRAEATALRGCFVDGDSLKGVLTDIQAVAAMALDLSLEAGRLPDGVSESSPEDVSIRLPIIIQEHHFRRSRQKSSVPQSKPKSRRKLAAQA